MATAEPACDVSGTWSDNFGTIYLRMVGGSVSGNYTWQNGTLSGTMDGVWINGTWKEEPTFAAPRDAGTFSWQVGEDCSVFTGTYSYAENPEGVAGSWSGTRTSTAEPLDPIPEAPACDPRGMWTSNHGELNLFALGAWRDLEANWKQLGPSGEQWVTMAGKMEGTRYVGTWRADKDPTPRHFVMRFDTDCETFVGDWTGLDADGAEVIHNDWAGQRTALAPVPAPRAPATTTPAESTVSPTTAPTSEEEHLPGIGEDEDDPLGIPAPSLALVFAVVALLAVALRTRRR